MGAVRRPAVLSLVAGTIMSDQRDRRGIVVARARGSFTTYRAGKVNHCPGCSGNHWIVGRQSAECADCETVLPLQGELE